MKLTRWYGPVLLAATIASGQPALAPPPPTAVESTRTPGSAAGGDGGIHLPPGRTTAPTWSRADALGYRWDISRNGSISDGSDDAYDGGMRLRVNGQEFPARSSVRVNADNTEIEFGPWRQSGLVVWRRVFVNVRRGYCRWIDIFENPTDSRISVSVEYYSNMGDSTGRTYTTSGGADLISADWGVVTCGESVGSRRPAVVHVFATPSAALRPSFQFARDSDDLYCRADLTVPGGKAVALCMFQAQRRPYASAVKFLKEFDPVAEVALLPRALRDILLNMSGPRLDVGGVSLHRSRDSDRIVLRNGDELLGRIANVSFRIDAGFAKVELPAGKVLGLVGTCPHDADVRVVLSDGQVLAGRLLSGPVVLALPDATELKIDPGDMREAAFRISPDRPEQPSVADPLLVTRRAERLAFDAGGMTFRFLTAHGALALRPADLKALEMDTPGGGLHRAVFRNGSTLAGLLGDEHVSVRLKLGPQLEIPRQRLKAIFLPTSPIDPADQTRLDLRNGDVLWGSLGDRKWTLQGKFGRIDLEMANVSQARFFPDALGRVELLLSGGTKVVGRLSRRYVDFQVQPGPRLRLFVGRVKFIRVARPPASGDAGTPGRERILGGALENVRKEVARLEMELASTKRALASNPAESALRERAEKLAKTLADARAALAGMEKIRTTRPVERPAR